MMLEQPQIHSCQTLVEQAMASLERLLCTDRIPQVHVTLTVDALLQMQVLQRLASMLRPNYQEGEAQTGPLLYDDRTRT